MPSKRRSAEPPSFTAPAGMRHVDPEVAHPFCTDGWRAFVVGDGVEPSASDIARAEALEAEAARHFTAREESFQRCDTDGFLSQWASGWNGREASANAALARQGGREVFPGLYRRDTGERVRAKLIRSQFGYCWAFCDARGDFTGKFLSDARTTRAKLFREGFVVLGEWAPAKVVLTGEGTGLSGNVWLVTRRTDGGYPGGNGSSDDAVEIGAAS